MLVLKKSALRFPVGLVKALKPLGHSGHLKLQAVVGSKDNEKGMPHTFGFWVHRVM